jgi:hypothetical protein
MQVRFEALMGLAVVTILDTTLDMIPVKGDIVTLGPPNEQKDYRVDSVNWRLDPSGKLWRVNIVLTSPY